MKRRGGRSVLTVPAGFAALLLGAAALASCGAEKAAPARPEPLPKEVCAKAKEAVDGTVKGGAIALNSPVDAVMMEPAWFALAPSARDSLLTALALAATCAGEPRLEQEVTIHSDTGTVLARRVVQTSYSMSDALSDQ